MEFSYDAYLIFKIGFSVFLCFSVLLYVFVIYRKQNNVRSRSINGNTVFITAHPDDECMFFGPAIIAANNTSLLCFTTGNYEKKGDVRRKEIIQSCSLLGVLADRITVLDNSLHPDDPRVQWDRELVCSEIIKYCRQHNISQIYTFDDYGVSGHSNHRELYHAIRTLKVDRKDLNGVRCYSLESVSIIRKYVSILDLPYSLYTADKIFISSPSDVLRAQRAMYAHWSQFVWFRVLFILFSRYLIINTCKEIISNKHGKTWYELRSCLRNLMIDDSYTELYVTGQEKIDLIRARIQFFILFQ